MNPRIYLATLCGALIIAGCGNNDDNEFNKGDRNNYPVVNSPGQVVAVNPSAPVVTLDSGTLVNTRGAAGTAFSPGALINDLDTTNFAGGILVIIAGNGSNPDLILTGPGTPDIGNVVVNGTGRQTIALNNNATAALIQQYLRAVTFASSGNAAFGPTSISVALSDGTGLTSQTATRLVNVTGGGAVNLTVGQGGITTIQQAVNQVAAANSGQGSTITIPAGTFNETVTVSNDPDLAGLQLIGPNALNSAGVTPGNRSAEATFNRLTVDSPNVALRGLTIAEGVDLGINEAAAVFLQAGANNFTAINNRFVRTGAPGAFRGLVNAVGTTNGNTTLQNNLFQGFATGVFLQGSTPATPTTGSRISGNAFRGNQVGISMDNPQDAQITGNGFANQAIEQIGLLNPGNTVIASGNSFDTSSSLTVFTGGAADTGSLDARNNFFGSATGPATAGNNPRVNTNGPGTFNVQTSPFATTNPFPGF